MAENNYSISPMDLQPGQVFRLDNEINEYTLTSSVYVKNNEYVLNCTAPGLGQTQIKFKTYAKPEIWVDKMSSDWRAM